MTTTDWIVDIALVLVVFRQIRETRIDVPFVLIPLALVSYFGYKYLWPIPTAGHDLGLVAAFATVGAILGLLGGLATRVRAHDGHVFARAGFTAAALWVLGMGARMGFTLWTEHGGGPTLVRFSAQNHFTSIQAWISGLIIMVLCEVGIRIGTIVLRAQIARRRAAAAQTAQATQTAQTTRPAQPRSRVSA